jgi:hypothetical protein
MLVALFDGELLSDALKVPSEQIVGQIGCGVSA